MIFGHLTPAKVKCQVATHIRRLRTPATDASGLVSSPWFRRQRSFISLLVSSITFACAALLHRVCGEDGRVSASSSPHRKTKRPTVHKTAGGLLPMKCGHLPSSRGPCQVPFPFFGSNLWPLNTLLPHHPGVSAGSCGFCCFPGKCTQTRPSASATNSTPPFSSAGVIAAIYLRCSLAPPSKVRSSRPRGSPCRQAAQPAGGEMPPKQASHRDSLIRAKNSLIAPISFPVRRI